MEKFHNELVTYNVDHKHINSDKHTSLLWNPYITSLWQVTFFALVANHRYLRDIECWRQICLQRIYFQNQTAIPGNPYWKGRLSTVDLLKLAILDQLLLIMQKLFTFLLKRATLMRSSTVLSLPVLSVFPAFMFQIFCPMCWNVWNLWKWDHVNDENFLMKFWLKHRILF